MLSFIRIGSLVVNGGVVTIKHNAIKRGLRSMNEEAALITARYCKNRNIPLHTIKEWANSDFWIYQCASLYASTGKPEKEYILIIENLCKSSDDFVKQLAKEIHAQQNNND